MTLIERSTQKTGTRAERVARLEERLSALPAEEIVGFAAWWTLAADRGCAWEVPGAGSLQGGG